MNEPAASTKPASTLLWVGTASFWVSMLLPSYDDMRGWECAQIVFQCLPDFLRMVISLSPFEEIAESSYYSAFNLTNAFMASYPVLLRIGYLSPKVKYVRWALLVLIAHTASWFIKNHGESIQIGYWIWLLSMILVYISMRLVIRHEPTSQPETEVKSKDDSSD